MKTINASAVFHNDHTAFRVDWMPFAGLKHSGLWCWWYKIYNARYAN